MNKNIFTNWYKRGKFECFGFTPEEPDEAAIETYTHEFYRQFYIPLAYIASGKLSSWGTVYRKALKSLYENSNTSVEVYDRTVEKLLEDAETDINDVFTYFNSLSTGLVWMCEVFSFIKDYRRYKDQTIKEAVYTSWEEYTQNHEVHLGWFGMRGEEAGKDVYVVTANPVITYEEGQTTNGGSLAASLIGLPFISYDTARIQLARNIVAALPSFLKYIPKMEIERLQNGKVIKEDTYVTELGQNGYPPIEAVQLYEVISPSEKEMYETFTATLNYHMSIGANMAQPIIDWLKSNEVINYLEEHYEVNIEAPTITHEVSKESEVKKPVTIEPPSKVTPETSKKDTSNTYQVTMDLPTGPSIKTLEEKVAELEKKLVTKDDEIVNLKKQITELEETLERTINEQLEEEQSMSDAHEQDIKELEKHLTEAEHTIDQLNSQKRFDQLVYDRDILYRASNYLIYIIKTIVPDSGDVNANMDISYLRMILWHFVAAPKDRTLEDVLHEIEVLEYPNRELYTEVMEKLYDFIRRN